MSSRTAPAPHRPLQLLLAVLLCLGLTACAGADTADEAERPADVTADDAGAATEADAAPTPEEAAAVSDRCGSIDPEPFRAELVGTRSDIADAPFEVTEEGDRCTYTLVDPDPTDELGSPAITVRFADEDFDAAVAAGESPEALTGLGDQASYVASAPDAPFGAVVVEVGDQVLVVSGLGRLEDLEPVTAAVVDQL